MALQLDKWTQDTALQQPSSRARRFVAVEALLNIAYHRTTMHGSSAPPVAMKGKKGRVGENEIETPQMNKLPVVPGARSSARRPTVSDAALTTAFKSDVMLLQLKSDKLERLWGAVATSSGKPTYDHEIKAILAQTSSADAVIARENYASMEEAVCMLSMKIALNGLVDHKMQVLEKLVLQSTSLQPEQSTAPTATLSRLPTFLALIDRLVLLHTIARNNTLDGEVPRPPSHDTNNVEPRHGKEEALMARIGQLQCELSQLTMEFDVKYREAEDRWHREANVLKQECSSQNNTIMALQDEVDATKRALRRAAHDLEAATIKTDLLQQECRRHDAAMRTLLEEKDALATQVHDGQATVGHWKAELDGIQHRFQAQMDARDAQRDAAHAAELQRVQDKHTALQESTAELQRLVTSLTEEDDALVQRVERWLVGLDESGATAIDMDGISGLKVAKAIAAALQQVGYTLACLRSSAAARTRDAASSACHMERQLGAMHDQLADAKAAIASLESVAVGRLDTIEQLRVQLDEASVQRELQEAVLHQTIARLNVEITGHLETIDQLQQDKRNLIQSQCSDSEVLAMDTFEQVVKAEFETMKRAFEVKAKHAIDQMEAQEKLHFKQVQDLVRKHQEDRMVQELKAKKVAHDLRILQERCKLLEANP
ncbi:hypothetical protein, variant [Aphanomyces invadans]|uniref:Uncharacterized protein n=1 Tax=Aphanomyces invadans TaxID=157072 RepID=A0A024UIT2_9STRA|nr:hypothetical protein, variant [Aphanomyces invadans]ETW06100.1 hypothetical protein, variant [Aphanomyces invadans]|eukprot:XP_008865877.1 hypothetical protein, variant [Aphanomyces invadans]